MSITSVLWLKLWYIAQQASASGISITYVRSLCFFSYFRIFSCRTFAISTLVRKCEYLSISWRTPFQNCRLSLRCRNSSLQFFWTQLFSEVHCTNCFLFMVLQMTLNLFSEHTKWSVVYDLFFLSFIVTKKELLSLICWSGLRSSKCHHLESKFWNPI